jgi:asparagine N-glycosylation enzyme membrane subunit Stt3
MFSIKQYLPRIKNYFRRNPEALFIVGFQVLLLVCAGLLISGYSFWAEGVAVVAYFSLVIGVVLQLISFLRHRESELEDNER